MHSQLALTEHVSLNLAPLILLDPVQKICDSFIVLVILVLRKIINLSSLRMKAKDQSRGRRRKEGRGREGGEQRMSNESIILGGRGAKLRGGEGRIRPSSSADRRRRRRGERRWTTEEAAAQNRKVSVPCVCSP